MIASAQAFWRRSGIASDLIDYAALGGDFNSSDLTDGAKPMWHNDSKHLTLLRRIAVQQERVISRGGCLCGGVRYSVRGALRDIIACHCSQCRRTSGHFVAATGAASDRITFEKNETLVWFASSSRAERGFCGRCGGNLFWRPLEDDRGWTSIMAGTLDPPTQLKLKQHIFVADKSDYYEITDGAEQRAE